MTAHINTPCTRSCTCLRTLAGPAASGTIDKSWLASASIPRSKVLARCTPAGGALAITCVGVADEGFSDTSAAADVSAGTNEAATRPSGVSSLKLEARTAVDTVDPLRSIDGVDGTGDVVGVADATELDTSAGVSGAGDDAADAGELDGAAELDNAFLQPPDTYTFPARAHVYGVARVPPKSVHPNTHEKSEKSVHPKLDIIYIICVCLNIYIYVCTIPARRVSPQRFRV